MGEPKLIGLVLGLAIGIVFVWIGVWQALVVGALGMAGFLVGKYIDVSWPSSIGFWRGSSSPGSTTRRKTIDFRG